MSKFYLGILSLGLLNIVFAADIQTKKTSIIPKVTPPTYMLYTYQGDKYRDPFIPLIGSDVRADQSDRPPQIAALSLKGIIQDSKNRMALLTTGVNSFILRGGRLFDARNKMVKGISGVIKTNSVLMIGSDHTVKEFKVDNKKT